MPTVRNRFQVTETNELEHALDEAAKRWPGEPRSRLLQRVITAGARALSDDESEIVRSRRESIQRIRGAYTNAYPADYLARLRADWPE